MTESVCHIILWLIEYKQRKVSPPLGETLVNLSSVLSWSVQWLCPKPLWLELHPYWSRTTPRRESRSGGWGCTSGWDSNPSASPGESGLQYTWISLFKTKEKYSREIECFYCQHLVHTPKECMLCQIYFFTRKRFMFWTL